MQESRRNLLLKFVTATGTFVFSPALTRAFQFHQSPQPLPSPNAPNPYVPLSHSGLDGADIIMRENKSSIDPQIWSDMKTASQKLYDAASELKNQIAATNMNHTLPLTVVKKAQEAEKLAKQIKEGAKG